jgi:hypothetical protein
MTTVTDLIGLLQQFPPDAVIDPQATEHAGCLLIYITKGNETIGTIHCLPPGDGLPFNDNWTSAEGVDLKGAGNWLQTGHAD